MTHTQAQNRPFLPRLGTDTNKQSFWDRIVWGWWLKRIPLLLLAFPSAYGVGKFAASSDQHMPWVVAAVAGLSFEAAYIGAIAIADQSSGKHWGTSLLWGLVNFCAVAASVACNLLFFSGGTYAAITLESATHAIPLPVLGFFYGLLLHMIATDEARMLEAERKAEQARVHCPHCMQPFKNRESLWGHLRTCAQRSKV